jgi:hypothetical protein
MSHLALKIDRFVFCFAAAKRVDQQCFQGDTIYSAGMPISKTFAGIAFSAFSLCLIKIIRRFLKMKLN